MTRLIEDVKLDICDVLMVPKRSLVPSRKDTKLSRKFIFLNSGGVWEGFPLIAANMDTTGTIAMSRVLASEDCMTCLHKHYPLEELKDFFANDPAKDRVFYTLGIRDDDIERLQQFSKLFPLRYVCLDVANGYTKYFVDKVKYVRDLLPEAVIMAGNVCTPEMVQELLIAGGADIVKIGIGPGSVCTTRIITGCGYPQFSAVLECADAAHGLRGHICSDGGCTQPGDIAKVFGAGADFVMVGGMLAGTDECDGKWETAAEVIWDEDGKVPPKVTGQTIKKNLKFYGMSSREAMDRYSGGVAHYKAAEGKCVKVPYKGPALDVVRDIKGGVSSGMSIVGAVNLKDLSKCAAFIKVNRTHNQIFGG